jgi:hypothetical protein
MEIYNAILKLQKGDKTDESSQVSLSLSHSLSLSLSLSFCRITSAFLGMDAFFNYGGTGNLFAGLDPCFFY